MVPGHHRAFCPIHPSFPTKGKLILFPLIRTSYLSPLPKSSSSFVTQLEFHLFLQKAFPDPRANSLSSEWPLTENSASRVPCCEL